MASLMMMLCGTSPCVDRRHAVHPPVPGVLRHLGIDRLPGLGNAHHQLLRKAPSTAGEIEVGRHGVEGRIVVDLAIFTRGLQRQVGSVENLEREPP
jgi:hypothetical protein